MKFYLEYPTQTAKRNKSGNPTVLALPPSNSFKARNGTQMHSVLCTATDGRTQFTWTEVDSHYLKIKCRRVSEETARAVHPEIFNCGLL